MTSFLLMGFTLVWITDFGSCGERNETSYCKPAEEEKEYSLKFTGSFQEVYYRDAIVYISRGNIAVAACFSLHVCSDYQKAKYNTSSVMAAGSSEITITVRIYNVSRDLQDGNTVKWYLTTNEIDSQVLGRCTLVVFSRVQHIFHRKTLLENNIYLLAWSSLLHTKAICYWYSNLSETHKMIVQSHSNITSESVSQRPIRHMTYCSLYIPVGLLKMSGSINVSVMMYPNITGETEDRAFGTTESIDINLDPPRVTLDSCTEIVEEDAEVTCACKRADMSLVNASLTWYDSSGERVANNGSHVLRYTARRTGSRENRVRFYCRAINNHGLENEVPTKYYSPTIIAKVRSITCDTETSYDVFTVTCKGGHIYPPGRCRFNISYKHTDAEVMSTRSEDAAPVVLTNTPLPGEPRYYNSTCVVRLPRRALGQEVVGLSVVMYPNATGGEHDLQLGTYRSISITPAENNSLTQRVGESFTLSSGPGIISFIFVLNVLILVIMIAVMIRLRLAGKTKIKGDYDDISLTSDPENEDGYRPFVAATDPGEVVVETHEYESIQDVIDSVVPS